MNAPRTQFKKQIMSIAKNDILPDEFLQEIRAIIESSKSQAVRSVEFYRVQMYWKLGERIFTEEQHGKDRAEYGTYLIRNLAEQIEPEFGSGFSYRQLNWCRQFYRIFPTLYFTTGFCVAL